MDNYRASGGGEDRERLLEARDALLVRGRKCERTPLTDALRDHEAGLAHLERVPLGELRDRLEAFTAVLEAAEQVAGQRRARWGGLMRAVALTVALAGTVAGLRLGQLVTTTEARCAATGGPEHGTPHVNLSWFAEGEVAHVSCVAKSDADCASVCRRDGRCVRSEAGRCVRTAPEHCTQSMACRLRHECSLVGDACVVLDRDCAKTEACRRDGKCRAVKGRCKGATPEGCRQSELCADDGRCSMSFNERFCIANDDDDCSGSKACRDEEHCHAMSDGRCGFGSWKPTVGEPTDENDAQ